MAAAVAALVLAATVWTLVPAGAAGPLPRVLPADLRAPLTYVALGDSTVEGIGASARHRNYVSRLHQLLRRIYPRARVVNLGQGGATAADVRVHQLPRALDLSPDLVTLSVGPNDITQGRTLEAYARDVDAILDALARETRAVVVLNLLPDMAATPRFRGSEREPLIRRRVVAFNEVLAERARAHGAEVVDLYVVSQRELPARPELVASDDYHPSDEGYARWAELMWEGVAARRPR